MRPGKVPGRCRALSGPPRDQGAVVVGVVVGGAVVAGGDDVEGAGAPALSGRGIGAGVDGDVVGNPSPGPATSALGGEAVERGAGVGGAGAPAGAGTVDVGMALGRGLDAPPASHMSAATPTNPSRNAAMHAPTNSRRRRRGVAWSCGRGCSARSTSRTVAGETGTGQRPTARSSCRLVIRDRPLTFFRRASS